jgi:hypothetical protein
MPPMPISREGKADSDVFMMGSVVLPSMGRSRSALEYYYLESD